MVGRDPDGRFFDETLAESLSLTVGQEVTVERRRHRVDVGRVLSGPSLARHRDPEQMETTNRNAPALVGRAAAFERIPEGERRRIERSAEVRAAERLAEGRGE